MVTASYDARAEAKKLTAIDLDAETRKVDQEKEHLDMYLTNELEANTETERLRRPTERGASTSGWTIKVLKGNIYGVAFKCKKQSDPAFHRVLTAINELALRKLGYSLKSLWASSSQQARKIRQCCICN